MIGRPPTDVMATLRTKIVVSSAGCWLWPGHPFPSGYHQVRVWGRYRYVHRIVYETLVGPIPDGMELDHLCRVRRCCNPQHLEAVTHQENVRRGHAARGVARLKPRKEDM